MENNISFTSKFISPAVIQKRCLLGKRYKPKNVSFVEIFPSSQKDRAIIKKLSEQKKWEKSYLSSMLLSMEYYEGDTRFFTIVNRKKTNKIRTGNILGFAEIQNLDENNEHINFLQVKPEYINNSRNPNQNIKYKGIGTALLENILKIFNCKNIQLKNVGASKFYEKFGFVSPDDTNLMVKKTTKKNIS